MKSFNHKEIEKKWRKYWEINKTNNTDVKSSKEKFYCLDMFPYPSGDGLHVGHWRGYVLSDVIARYNRLNHKEVLHPMGFDSFGLPAENAAIKTGINPKENTENSIANFTRQLQEIGSMYDWSKTLSTHKPDYYQWTQWLFRELYLNKLAYRKEGKVNWCPSCQTVLANEQVNSGLCERCGTEVIKKNLKQWYFKISEYADELLRGIDDLDWSETIKTLQKNWIGKSQGISLSFQIKDTNHSIKVFTTRLDTIFGTTFLALAPESNILDEIITQKDKQELLTTYRNNTQKISDIERGNVSHEKTGFDTGLKAINPFNNEEIPIFVADYILLDYGTGAVMCVPAHDQRDYEFAQKFAINIKTVIAPSKNETEFLVRERAFEEKGYLINSAQYNGLSSEQAVTEMLSDKKNIVRSEINYKMRDWLVSRQRYWGAPIPIIYCPKCGEVLVPEEQLPVLLPKIDDFRPKGQSPLSACDEFVNTKCPNCSGQAQRETDTLDTFVDSAWYYLRFPDPENTQKAFDSNIINRWLPVDQYIGGVEHATKHLLYARFITKFLADQNYLNFREPFKKLFGIGLIYYHGAKMSKSKGNVVNPDELVNYYGTDALRGYEMFIGPNDQFAEWSAGGINGIYRFLVRFYNLVLKNINNEVDNLEISQKVDTAIYLISENIGQFKTNLAISQAMTLINEIEQKNIAKKSLEKLVITLSPFFPFICEELWSQMSNKSSVFDSSWPKVQKSQEKMKNIPLQINSKIKKIIKTANFANQPELEAEAINIAISENLVKKDQIKKVICVAGKIVNIVTH